MKFIQSIFKFNKFHKRNPTSPLIIFESDDWGCIRMPSKKVKQHLVSISPESLNDPYLQYDSLETNEDLETLFNLLSTFKDIHGKHPVITANYILQNPDFSKIRDSNYEEFFGIDFRDSLADNQNSDRVYTLAKQAFQEGIFKPQFHGREHIHIERWLKALRSGDPLLRLAFENNLISLRGKRNPPCISFFMDAFHPTDEANLKLINYIIEDGLKKFRVIWNCEATSVIAPCYFWHHNSERVFADYGVKIIQGIRVQKESNLNGNVNDYRKIIHKQGDNGKFGPTYFYRSAFFEPSTDGKRDWISHCLSQVQQSIRRFGFSIISSHRLNFIGAIEPLNRDRNIIMFQELLIELHRLYPGLQYGTSLDLLETE